MPCIHILTDQNTSIPWRSALFFIICGAHGPKLSGLSEQSSFLIFCFSNTDNSHIKMQNTVLGTTIGKLVLSVFVFYFVFFLKFLAVYKSHSLARTGTQIALN